MSQSLKDKTELLQKVLVEVPELRYAGDVVLRQPTIEVSLEEGTQVAERLASILLKYRELTGFGRGLAASQIGENVSVYITYIDNVVEVFINPVIVEASEGKNFYKELCMSAGILAADVERPEWVIMKWTDKDGNERTEKFDGFKARLHQHEEAHLRGRLNLDDAVSGGIEFATFDPLKEQLRNSK